MLVAKIEIWPYGHEDEKRDISEVLIANTLHTNEDGEHQYVCKLGREGDWQGSFYHQRADGAEACVRRALEVLT